MTQNDYLESFDGDQSVEKAHSEMVADGHTVSEKKPVNYFGIADPENWYLPDGVQYFSWQPLNEGKKSKYERATNKDIRVQRTTGDAKLAVDTPMQRQTLVKLSTVGAHILAPAKSGMGQLVPLSFDASNPGAFWERIFTEFPPEIIQDYFKFLQEKNPWMIGDEDIEAMEKEYESLGQRIDAAKEEAAKKAAS